MSSVSSRRMASIGAIASRPAFATSSAFLSMLLHLTLIGAAQASVDETTPVPQDSRELLLVRTTDWQAITGSMQRYTRVSPQSAWHAIGSPIRIVVGRAGLAWGNGLTAPPATAVESGQPIKIEGDGKAPAGVFDLGTAFGYAPVAELAPIRMTYLQTRESDLCVDDVDSHYYNTLVSTLRVAPDWNSAELLHRKDDLYRLGVVVEHNWGVTKKRGEGSCIFLHVWSAADAGTDGCTAMADPAIRGLIAWLDPKRHPVLVQLPAAQYRKLKASWALP